MTDNLKTDTNVDVTAFNRWALRRAFAVKGALNAYLGFSAATTILLALGDISPWKLALSLGTPISVVAVNTLLGHPLKNSAFTDTNISLPRPSEDPRKNSSKPSLLKFNLSTFTAGFAGFGALVGGIGTYDPITNFIKDGTTQINSHNLISFTMCAAGIVGTKISLRAAVSSYRKVKQALHLTR